MSQLWTTTSPAETHALAVEILAICKNRRIFAIFGDLGAGKTLLVKALCRALESENMVTSPTFSLVNEYGSPYGTLYHMDLYRLHNKLEFREIGLEELIRSGNYLFIEWPELADDILPPETVNIRIDSTDGDNRSVLLELNN